MLIVSLTMSVNLLILYSIHVDVLNSVVTEIEGCVLSQLRRSRVTRLLKRTSGNGEKIKSFKERLQAIVESLVVSISLFRTKPLPYLGIVAPRPLSQRNYCH